MNPSPSSGVSRQDAPKPPNGRTRQIGENVATFEAGLLHVDGYVVRVEWIEADGQWCATLDGLAAIANPIYVYEDTRDMAVLSLCCAVAATLDCVDDLYKTERAASSSRETATEADEIERRIAKIEAGATRVMGFCEVDPDFSADCVSYGDALWLIAELRTARASLASSPTPEAPVPAELVIGSAEWWESEYTDLRDAVLASFGEYVQDGEEAEGYLLARGLENAAARLAILDAAPVPAEAPSEDTADAERWRWFRQFLSVEDDAPSGGQYLFLHDCRVSDATVLPGYENTIESIVDAKIAADRGTYHG